jgi:ATP-dependent protease ClpP protease subunit
MRLLVSLVCRTILFGACTLASQLAFANVTVLHDASAPDDIGGTILIHSEIKTGDFTDFQKAADRIRLIEKDTYKPVPLIQVRLDSPGGDVMEAIRIGRLIHERFMHTVVMPERECASACVFILAAGVLRIPTQKAHVAVHRPRFDPTYFAALAARGASK